MLPQLMSGKLRVSTAQFRHTPKQIRGPLVYT